MNKRILVALLPLCCTTPVAADFIGVKIGANYWDYDISGTARYKSSSSADDIDVNDDLGYSDDSLTYFYASFEHPVPVLPNIRISKTRIDTNANGRLSRQVTYGGTTFQANEDVKSDVKADQIDITLYYSPLDNVVNLDLGLNAKYIDSDATIQGAISGSQSADVSGWVPMAYAGVGVDLPLTGLSISADGSYIGYKDSKFYDFTVRASYTTPWFVGVDAGYRKIKLDLDDFDNSYADVEFAGPFAGAYLQF